MLAYESLEARQLLSVSPNSSVDTTATASVAADAIIKVQMPLVPNDPSPVPIAFQDGLYPSVAYAGTSDTKISSRSKSKNYGTAASLLVDGNPDEASLFRWDISAIPAGSSVVSAAIELNALTTTIGNFEVYALQRAWDEISATWQRSASVKSWSAAGASGAGDHGTTVLGRLAPRTRGIYRIALNDAGAAAVQSWINDAATNYGVILKDYTVSDGVSINSSEAVTARLRPKLIVDYKPAAAIPVPLANLPGFADVLDPGPGQTIVVGQRGYITCEVTTKAAETRALGSANNLPVGQPLLVTLKADGGDLTVTGSADGNVLLKAEGQFALFVVTRESDGSHRWRSISKPPQTNTSLNATDFGAVGNGIVDSTAAIQAAIDAAPATGGTVVIPRGTFLVRGTLTVNKAVSIAGEGASSIVQAADATFNVFTVSGTATGISFSRLAIFGAATSNATTQFGIFSAPIAPNGVTIQQCLFSGPNATTGLNSAIKCDTGNYWTVSHNRIERLIGTTSNRGYGCLFGTAAWGRIYNNVFIGAPGQGRHAVYLSAGCSCCYVHDNLIESFNESGIAVWSQNYHPPNQYCFIHGNLVRGGGIGTTGTAGIELGFNSKDCVISNNTVHGFYGDGIIINGFGSSLCLRNKVINSNVSDCQLRGINVIAGAAETLVQGNTVHDNSQASAGIHAGIRLDASSTGGSAAVDRTRVSGNFVYGLSHRASFLSGGSAPLPTNTYLASDNVLGNAVVAPIELNGATLKIGTVPPRTVNVGPNQTTPIGQSTALQGTISDGGQPSSAGLWSLWTKVSGPGTVTFDNAVSLTTTTRFSAVGNYLLRLTVSDGVFGALDELSVSVVY